MTLSVPVIGKFTPLGYFRPPQYHYLNERELLTPFLNPCANLNSNASDISSKSYVCIFQGGDVLTPWR